MRLNGYCRSRTFNGNKLFEIRRAVSRHRRRGAHSVIGCSAPGAIRASTFPPQGL